MKKKLLVLSASAILASNFVFDNSASAVVKTTDYKSDALEVKGNIYPHISLKRYLDSLNSLAISLSVGDFSGYDEPEYKDAYRDYQNRFLAEIEATVKFVLEDNRKVDYIKNNDFVEGKEKLGLTHERYDKIYENLKKHKNEFEHAVYRIEEGNENLKRFDYDNQVTAINKIYDIEDKVYMVAKAFPESEFDVARDELFNKLYLIVGYSKREREEKLPTNQRMVDEMSENLETIIDDFFNDIDYKRPKNITPLKPGMGKNVELINNFRKEAEKAQSDSSLVDEKVKERADKASKYLDELVKKSRKDLADKSTVEYPKVKYFSSSEQSKPRVLKQTLEPQKDSLKELSITFPESTQQLPIYTESTQSHKQPVLKQQVKEEKVDVLKSKRPESALKGMTGESNLVTMDTHSNTSTLSGSNGQVFDFSFESAPQMTNVAQPQTKEAVAAPMNNLVGLSGESNALNFTYDSQPVNKDTFTESNEIVLDQHTDIKVSGYTTGESIEDSHVSNEVTK